MCKMQSVQNREMGEQMRSAVLSPLILLLDLSLIACELSKGQVCTENRRTSSSGVKSLTMLNSFRISSGVLPLIMFATVLHPTSLGALNGEFLEKYMTDLQKGLDI